MSYALCFKSGFLTPSPSYSREILRARNMYIRTAPRAQKYWQRDREFEGAPGVPGAVFFPEMFCVSTVKTINCNASCDCGMCALPKVDPLVLAIVLASILMIRARVARMYIYMGPGARVTAEWYMRTMGPGPGYHHD